MDRYHTLLLYFKMDSDPVYRADLVVSAFRFRDSSGSNASIDNITSENLARLDTPRYQSTPQPLSLDVWNDLAICTQLELSPRMLWPVTIRGDQLATPMQSITNLLSDGSVNI